MPPAKPAEEKAGQVQTEAPGFVPAYILRNRGVPIRLYRLENGELPDPPDDLDEAEEETWEPPTRKVHLRFNANHLAELEEAWDGLRAIHVEKDADTGEEIREERVYYGTEAFQKAMEVRTNQAIRKVLAIALETDEESMGRAMIPSEFLHYNNAVGTAWSLSQGVDPTSAARMLQEATVAAVAQGEALESQLQSMMAKASDETTDSPGATG